MIPKCTHFMLVLLVGFLNPTKAHSTVDPEAHLSNYDFVSNPKLDIYRHLYDTTHPKNAKRSLKHLPQLLHDDSFRVEFQAFNRTFYLHMEPNTDLIHRDAEIVTYDSAGNPTTSKLHPQKYLLYKGIVVESDLSEDILNQEIIGFRSSYGVDSKAGNRGWARLVVHQDDTKVLPDTRHTYEGVFHVGSETYQIQPISTYNLHKRSLDPQIVNPSARPLHQRYSSTIIYRLSDQSSSSGVKKRDVAKVGACGSEGLVFNRNLTSSNTLPPYDWIKGGSSILKRAPVGNGCPTSKKILYMGVAADCAYVKYYKSKEDATKKILSNWNTASGIYEKTFNIALGVIKLDIRSDICPSTPDSSAAWNRDCSDSYAISARLSDFSRWRGTSSNDGMGLWHLMTNCPSGSQVGVAWVDQTCTTTTLTKDTQFVSGTGVSSRTSTEWQVVAHEIGHNFGAPHDCISSQCPDQTSECCPCDVTCDCKGQYIMNPTSQTAVNSFSPCSIARICGGIPNAKCLEAPGGKTPVSESMCGNGIKEEGEECDCGAAEDCAKDPCCAPNCKLKPGALCSDSGDDCCQDCKIKAANTTCRAAQSECDLVETCDGVSPSCPKDIFVEDGKDCGASGGGLKCASGFCTSRDAQCAARGKTANIVKACSAPVNVDPCQLVCQNPNSALSCISLQGAFIDGTACGVNGKCLNGSCKTGNISKCWANVISSIGRLIDFLCS
ncbi:zincin [Basidiobolus meristosporus CBS 931.73]|uniref:Disintegrin and metalloproteinase domain-containing protein B n=1 Tax=Basidiobolus meristosporus CBS 931.73 TaxID=1314790 RepID=A0A1Y1YMJ4_9FUNG|nr:zincin [Basidiobolus meristosporus CBS 931.73]|eukprot:ORX98966.1 zincin [Basidiobolus meristosporus CBS 931.73]